MQATLNVLSKGIMGGAAIMVLAIRSEDTFYNCIALGLFSLAVMGHIAMSLSATTLLLYILPAILMPPILVVTLGSRPYIFPSLSLEYAPIIIAFVLYIVEDCSRSYGEAQSHLWRWAENLDSEGCTQSTSHIPAHKRTLGSHNPTYTGSGVDETESILSRQDSLLFKYVWSRSPSRVPSSRLSDISLSSSRLESLPSSWGTLTRTWFPEFAARAEDSFDEPDSDSGECNPFRTVRGDGYPSNPACHHGLNYKSPGYMNHPYHV